MKIAFVFNEKKTAGKLTKFFTGCYCYHVAIVDEERDILYDMNLLRRKRRYSSYSSGKTIVLIESPVTITSEYLEEQLLTDNNRYGILDYLRFGLRPLYHLFGASTPNAGGVICSEMVHNDLFENGWAVLFPEVPSPCDLYEVLRLQVAFDDTFER